MNFFQSMDLYKGIVLLSIVLLPLGGWWLTELDAEIAACNSALKAATRKGGHLEDIGRLQRQIETVARNRRKTSEAIRDPSTYFDRQIRWVNTNLRADDFTLSGPTQKPANLKGRKQRATDHVMSVNWGTGTNKKSFGLEFVFAVAFNCESGATQGVSSGPPSVWRLRELSLANVTGESFATSSKVPTPELKDDWYIKKMSFARREPAKRKARR